MSFPDCIWLQYLAVFRTKMSALRVKLALRKQQPVPERLGGPELMGAPRPPNSRRKAVPTITDLKLKIRRRKVPVPSCETTLSLEPLTLEPIVTRQPRKPSLKRKQVFAWTSSSGSQEETAPKRPKPRKKRMKKKEKKEAQGSSSGSSPDSC